MIIIDIHTQKQFLVIGINLKGVFYQFTLYFL